MAVFLSNKSNYLRIYLILFQITLNIFNTLHTRHNRFTESNMDL